MLVAKKGQYCLRLFSSSSSAKNTIVYKFGGSSVGSDFAMQSTGEVLASTQKKGNWVVGVVSAMYGITNKLVASVEAAAKGDLNTVKGYREKVWSLHEITCNKLLSPAGSKVVLDRLDRHFREEFDETVKSVMERQAFTAWDMDLVSSLGERFSSRMMAQHLNERGASAVSVQADDVIITNGVAGDSVADIEATRKNAHILKDMMAKGTIPVVTGFLGRAPDGRVTTFGRGGSDVTATVLGNILNANEIALMKVECTADENATMLTWQPGWIGVVHDANPDHTVETLTYHEAAELAFWGKKVLHTHTTSYVENEGIPIRVGSSYEPDHKGTLIGVAPPEVAVFHAFTSLSYEALLEKLNKAKQQIYNQHAQGKVAIAAVGHNISADTNAVPKLVKILKEAHIDCEPLKADRVSQHSHAVWVAAENKKPALKALYNAYFKLR